MNEQIMMQLMEMTRQLTRIAETQEKILTAVSLQTVPMKITTPEEWKKLKYGTVNEPMTVEWTSKDSMDVPIIPY